MTIAPGETQFLRIANIGADMYYRLKLEGHKFYELARDGNRRTQLLELDELLLPPASRSEVLIQGAQRGTYAFRALAFDTGPAGDSYPETTLATLVSQGDAADAAVARARDAGGRGLPQLCRSRADARSRSTSRRTATRSTSIRATGRSSSIRTASIRRSLSGTVEEWTVLNPTQELHVFHIHQTDFQVTEINGVAQPFIGHQDNVNVAFAPTAGAPPGQVKLLIDFRNPNIVGKFVYHCHILEHEDGGMMAVAEVVPSISAAARSLATRVANVVRTALGREAIEDEREAIERAERTLNALQSGSYCAPGGAAKPGQGAPAPSSADEAT